MLYKYKVYVKRFFLNFKKNTIKKHNYENGPDQDILKCTIAYNKYGAYCIPESSSHRPAALKIHAGGIYEPNTINFILSRRRSGDLVHGGTYFGDFLPALSRSCEQGEKIWAFEPNEENYRCGQVTILLNRLKNIEYLNAGIADIVGQLPILVKDDGGQGLGGGSKLLLKKSGINLSTTQVASVVTIDSTVPNNRKIALIHLDVEGFELQALKGAIETIRRNYPLIILEIWPGSKLLENQWIIDHIYSLGYRKTAELHHNVVLSCDVV